MTVRLETAQTVPAARMYASEEYGQAVATADGGAWFEVRADGGVWSLPLIAREIPGAELRDASTPYGYGGLEIADNLDFQSVAGLWEQTRATLSEAGFVSLFLRFPPFLPEQAERLFGLPGLEISEASYTFVVPLGDAESMWAALHKRGRTAVRAAERNGCRAEIVTIDEQVLHGTRELYEQTMRRVGAADRYFFPDGYYAKLQQLGDRIVVARVRDASGRVVAASFILRDDQHAHYHLSGSTGTESGANNLMIWATMEWAADHGISSLHLGGGLAPGDSLHRFKASFGGMETPFHVGKAVLHADRYRELTYRHAAEIGADPAELERGAFFPAYRATV
ncbi:GNAT family N-acetyltransferase [Microbacterium sp. KUDC0406]|uniref:GNAT family N-acetyltransferase n=1 Tax=Microbacterium sp. KUDC0406 TaxID=2909588 RepID=UPI001F36B45D|nr:GNAT family N-acetyltransferase [Microbacterium sp. KUDC0406]UJP08918.1 GNAT family N-acetyltransferase [Microbacterium sp. KUDC0406]